MTASLAPDRVVVFGNGGLGKRMPSILSDLRDSGRRVELVGYLVRNVADSARDPLVLGEDHRMEGLEARYVVAISDPETRERLDKYARGVGKESFAIVHPRAYVESPVGVAAGCIVLPGSCIGAHAILGRQVIVNMNAVVGHEAEIGDYVTLNPLAMVGGGVRIGPRVSIGAGAVVLAGLKVNADAVIGAGAVVTRDVPEGARAVGVPARWEKRED